MRSLSQGVAIMLAEGPVPVLGGHELMILLLQVGLLLTLAVLLGRVAIRFRMSAIVGELLAGVLLGPSLLAHLLPRLSGWLLPLKPEQFHLLDAVGQIGVILLVGITGTQLDFGLVRRRSATAVRVAIPGLAVPLALGVAGGFLIPAALLARGSDRLVFALFVGVAMSVSAIPVIAKTLQDMGLLHRNIGQLTLAAATVDDTLGWLMLSIVAALATKGVQAAAIGRQIGLLVVFLVIVTVLGRPAVAAVMRIASRADGDGPITTYAVVIMVLGAAATQAMGLEAVFGAFVAGMVIGTCGHVDPGRLASMRTVTLCVIAPVFFATVGLRVDLTVLRRPVVLLAVLMMLAIAVIGKFAGSFAGAKASRLTRWEALALGAGLNARGVVQLVVATVGLQLGVLTTVTYTIVVLIAITTSVMTPSILRLAMAHVEHTDEERLRAAVYAAHVPRPLGQAGLSCGSMPCWRSRARSRSVSSASCRHRSASSGSAGWSAAHRSCRAALLASNSFSRSRSEAASSYSSASAAACRSPRTLSICSSRSVVSGPAPTRCSTAASRCSIAFSRPCTAGRLSSSVVDRADKGPLAWYPCSRPMTCWRTRFRSAPSLTSTCAATPSPSRIRPSRMCSVPT